MEFDDRETATLLAALRFWQQRICRDAKVDHRGVPLYESVPNNLRDYFAEHGPLSRFEIDTLCGKINFEQ